MANDNALPSSLKRRVIEKINANKLTIIVGPTGCGEYLAAQMPFSV
jgi:HrpA-like RNA helicase